MRRDNMIDKNINYNKYFLSLVKDFDGSTMLNPDLNGVKKPQLNKNELEIKKDKIEEFCNQNSISENILFLAGTSLALNKFNFSNKNLIFHENNIIFTTDFENREISIKDYLMHIQNDYLENLKYSKFSIDKIIDGYELQPEFYYAFDKDLDFNSFKYKYNFYLDIQKTGENFILSSYYNDQLYSDEYVNLFLKSIRTIINQFLSIDITKSTLSDISLVEENENIQFKEIEIPFIHKRFEKQVQKAPDSIALISNGEKLTYGELNEKSNRIANAIIKNGIKPKSNILIMLHRNSDLIASIIGTLKAGCAFIPIDPEYPQERINYIYENSHANYIITEKSGKNSLSVEELLSNGNSENPDVSIEADDLAYIIYTSGSTGNPKGVMVSHKGMCNQISGNPMENFDSILTISTISFIMSLRDILTGITDGIRLVFANDTEIKNIHDLIELIKNTQPEAVTLTPSRFLSYLEVGEFCDSINCFKAFIMGGEAFPAKKFYGLEKYTDATIFNAYGQSEGNFLFPVPLNINDDVNITIGKPLENSIADVRDIDGKLLPDGVMGELCFGGPSIGKGYYNSDQTNETFIEINGIPYCKSGDYAIKTPDGEFIFKGRKDNQIKLRGLRIELGEIESNISNYHDIKENIVLIKKINNADHLCAYFTAENEIDINELKEFLKD